MPWPKNTADYGATDIEPRTSLRRELPSSEDLAAAAAAEGGHAQQLHGQQHQPQQTRQYSYQRATMDEEDDGDLPRVRRVTAMEEEGQEQRGGYGRGPRRCLGLRPLVASALLAAALLACLALAGLGARQQQKQRRAAAAAAGAGGHDSETALSLDDDDDGKDGGGGGGGGGSGIIDTRQDGGVGAAAAAAGKPGKGRKGAGRRKKCGRGGMLFAAKELRQPEVRRAVDGVLDTTFRIVPARVEDGPVAFSSRTYEGMVPGPTLVLKPGETLRIKQVNGLGPETLSAAERVEHTLHWPNTTTIHTHGLHMDPSGVADNIFRTLASGEAADSVYHLRADHQPGTFYYHPHYHGSSTIQMAGGMAGALIVEDDPAALPAELRRARDLVCVLQHVNVASGTFRNYRYAAEEVYHSLLRPDVEYMYKDAPGNYFIVNGQYRPRVTVRPNEAVRLRLINAGINDYLLLQLPGCQVHEIAADGVYYARPRAKSTVMLVVGSRKDVLVQCPTLGTYPLVAVKQEGLVESYLGNGTDIFEGIILSMNVVPPDSPTSSSSNINAQDASSSGGSSEAPEQVEEQVDLPATYPTVLPAWLPAPDPGRMYQFADTRAEAIDDPERQRFEYVFTSGGKRKRGDGVTYSDLGVNGHILALTNVQRRVKLGSLEEWRITEAHTYDRLPERVNHPFHIHINHFQIVAMSHGEGVDYSVGDWRDSISLPLLPQGGGFVTIRWRANDYTGMAPAHCHIIAHADTGMSLTFEVYDDDDEDEEEAPSKEEDEDEDEESTTTVGLAPPPSHGHPHRR